jgi:hypothetical protein
VLKVEALTWEERKEGKEGRDRTGQDRTGQDRTGQDRTGQDRTGKERKGKERKGRDNFEHGYNAYTYALLNSRLRY